MAEEVAIQRSPWCADARDALAPALLEDLDEIETEVQSGVCELWRVHEPGDGWVVTRFEVYPAAPSELCIVAGAGRGYVDTLPHFVEIARKMGAGAVRVHTHRPGVCRWLERLGFTERERVYESQIFQKH